MHTPRQGSYYSDEEADTYGDDAILNKTGRITGAQLKELLEKREVVAKELRKKIGYENTIARRRVDIVRETSTEMTALNHMLASLQMENKNLKEEVATLQSQVEKRASDPGQRPTHLGKPKR